MPIAQELLRSLTGEYDEVAKAAHRGPAPSAGPVQSVETTETPGGEVIQKALVISVDGTDVSSASNARPSVEAEQNFFLGAGALIPRYDPWALARVWENSSALRPCIESYASNIDGYGFRLDPVIDLDKADAPDLVRSALRRWRQKEGDTTPVSDDDVAQQIGVMREEMEAEKDRLETFFAYCCPTQSFVELRMQTRTEVEALGGGYWEVIRDGSRQIQWLQRVDAVTMRLRPIHIEHVLVDTNEKVTPIHYRVRPVPRRFRTFVQLVNGLIAVYFKEFGDPRVLSAKTGNFYDSRAALRDKEGELAVEATEILYWPVFSPIGPYGVPRWVGATMNVLGLRASEEINFSYFDKKCIPPLAVLVSGGSLKPGAETAIKLYMKEQLQGRENFWSVMVIEAESSPGAAANVAARVKVELRPLTETQLKDALFQEYERNGAQKVGAQFRLPDLLRGVSQEVNRAQAWAVLQFAEQQVFEPIRQVFDHVMNRRILADMGIRYWVFKTNSAPASDPAQLVQLTTQLASAGALDVDETRALAAEALNKEFPKKGQSWSKFPFSLVQGGVVGLDGNPAGGGPPGAEGAPGAEGGAGPLPGPGAPEGEPPSPAGDGAAKVGAPSAGPEKGKKPEPGGPPKAPVPTGGNAPPTPGAESGAMGGEDLSAYFKAKAGAPPAGPQRLVVPIEKLLEWVEPDPAG